MPPWELFSLQQERIRHGVQHYRQQRLATWELLHQLYLTYALEDPIMAYTMEEFIREARRDMLNSLTPEQRQEFINQLPAEDFLKRLSVEEQLQGLGPEEQLQGLGPEERLRGLGPEELQRLEEYLKHLH